jgi:hypothetical protein
MPRFSKTSTWHGGFTGYGSTSDPGSETEEEDSSAESEYCPEDTFGTRPQRIPDGSTGVPHYAYPAPYTPKEGDSKRLHRPSFTGQYLGVCTDDVISAMFTDGHGRCGLGFLLDAIDEPFRRYIVHDVWYPRGGKPFGGFRKDVLRRLSQRVRLPPRLPAPRYDPSPPCTTARTLIDSVDAPRSRTVQKLTDEHSDEETVKADFSDASSDEEVNIPQTNTCPIYNVTQRWTDKGGLASRSEASSSTHLVYLRVMPYDQCKKLEKGRRFTTTTRYVEVAFNRITHPALYKDMRTFLRSATADVLAGKNPEHNLPLRRFSSSWK